MLKLEPAISPMVLLAIDRWNQLPRGTAIGFGNTSVRFRIQDVYLSPSSTDSSRPKFVRCSRLIALPQAHSEKTKAQKRQKKHNVTLRETLNFFDDSHTTPPAGRATYESYEPVSLGRGVRVGGLAYALGMPYRTFIRRKP